jgi:hypothetical protein
LIDSIFLFEIFAVFFFNLSFFQKTTKSKSIQGFFNNSIETIVSFHHHVATNALFETLKSFLIYFFLEQLKKLNSFFGLILLVYRNSHNQFI